MENIYDNVTELIGHTPLVRINKLNHGQAEILVKVESRNPGGSIKDRVGLEMINQAEARGDLKPGSTIIEPTSGNTGIGLALVGAVRGYKVILTMPETMSIERRKLLQAYGAQIVLTPGAEGMAGAIARAEELQRSTPGSFLPGQFDNPDNPRAHVLGTGEEIWRDCDGRINVLVCGVGTGGTLSGCGRFLKAQRRTIELVAVEPEESAVLSGEKAHPHKLQGIGAGFIPRVMDMDLLDKVVKMGWERAGLVARQAAKEEGLLIGISGGAALAAALDLSMLPEYAGKRIVVVLPDSGERYLSTWLFDGE